MRTILFLLIILVSSNCFALTDSVQSLIGLKRVKVSVVGIKDEYKIDITAVKTSIELKLRQNGIEVVKIDDPTCWACLEYSVNAMEIEKQGMYAYSISFKLFQLCTLERTSKPIIVYASTWDEGYFGYSGMARLEEAVVKNASTVTDKFLNDYLAANPKIEAKP
jgi:hypothetical protein